MAKFNVQGFDKLMTELDRLGRFEEIAPKMLEESIPILEQEVRERASAHWVSGDMVNSIKKPKKASRRGGGYYICVRPTGTDSKGVRNMEKLVYLEFGVKGRPAVPILTTAVLNAEPKVIAKMQEVFNREVATG